VQDVAYPLPAVDEKARASSDRASERGLTLLFGSAILVSSWLLFLVQPMFAKMVLPRLGGTPAVWNTCVVFFQATLLVGYLYAHLTTRWLGVRRQALMHLGVLLLPLFALPVAVTGEPPPATGTPVWWLLGVLGLSVGLPFFVVSTTSPLLQRWFSAMPHRAAKDPYFLYSSSNFASLLALVSYPAIIEPSLRLAAQSWMWTWAYGLFVALVAACALSLRSAARQGLIHDHADIESTASTEAPALTWSVRLRWLAFSFVPSSLMLGVTTHISTDIAAVPLLWVVPLALYLATFMLVFARRPLVPARGLARVLPFLVIATLVSLLFVNSPWWLILLHLVVFFVASLLCHFRLAATRPSPRHLTEFYLWMSIGGVLGGLFNTLAAPLLFTGILEYPLALAAACALRPSPGFRRNAPESWETLVGLPLMVVGVSLVLWALGLFGAVFLPTLVGIFALLWLVGLAFSNRPAMFGIVAAAAVLLFALAPSQNDRQVIFAARTFFGVHRVVEDGPFHRLQHGGTMHGLQRRDSMAMATCEPNSYYHPTGPLGQVFQAAGQRFTRVGVIGLGSGGTVCYGRPGQQWTFYEIDPTVERIARDRRLFTHLATTSASVDVRLGDGRLLLAEAAPASFDLLILDAFSSDAIPLHLVTREAIDLAFSRLRADGVLAFHISNRYLDLAPVLGAIARDTGLEARVNFDAVVAPAEQREGKQASRWLIMTRTGAAMGSLATDARWRPAPAPPAALWTDDFSNILSVFIWSDSPRTSAPD
jgi:spermidine synthase